MKNWKTTLGGILIAIGTPLMATGEEGWVKTVGMVLVAAGGLLTGAAARDWNVSSEDAGIK